jgi:DNA-binding CsgD family transcriptional regulator
MLELTLNDVSCAPGQSSCFSAPASRTFTYPASLDAVPAELMSLMLDEVGYGVMLLGAGQRLRFANYAAKQELQSMSSMGLYSDKCCSELARHPSTPADQLRMHKCSKQEAFLEAYNKARNGQRTVLALADERGDLSVTVLPLDEHNTPDHPCSVLVLTKRNRSVDELGMKLFARSCKVTCAEYNVLQALHAGLRPKEVATKLGVASTTVRTQIKSLRTKTGSRSVQELLQIISSLPPITPALRGLNQSVYIS